MVADCQGRRHQGGVTRDFSFGSVRDSTPSQRRRHLSPEPAMATCRPERLQSPLARFPKPATTTGLRTADSAPMQPEAQADHGGGFSVEITRYDDLDHVRGPYS
jgi:hypothetical protein